MKVKYIIEGNGSSLWGPSYGSFRVDRIEMNYIADECEKNDYFGELRAYGPDTEWSHYTDRKIEEEMNARKTALAFIRKTIAEKLGVKPKEVKMPKISWSEQGMQPDGGWSFDVSPK